MTKEEEFMRGKKYQSPETPPDKGPELDIQKYLEDADYRKKIDGNLRSNSFFYYELSDGVASVLNNGAVEWRPDQAAMIKSFFAKELVGLYPQAEIFRQMGKDPEAVIERDLGLAIEDQKTLPALISQAENYDKELSKESSSEFVADEEGGKPKTSKEKGYLPIIKNEIERAKRTKDVNLKLFETDPMYRIILREKNEHFGAYDKAEMANLLRKIIDENLKFGLTAEQINALLSLAYEEHREELAEYAKKHGIFSPGKIKAMKYGSKKMDRVQEEYNALKIKYIHGDFKTRRAFERAVDEMLQKNAAPHLVEKHIKNLAEQEEKPTIH